MTVMYAWPFLRLVSSTPIACNPSNMHGIEGLSAGRRPRLAMSPAVLHAICGKPLTVFWLATVISHAHSDSKSRVNRLPGSAHGTRETTTPCRRQSHSRDRAGKLDAEATEVLVPPASPAPAVVVSRGLSPAARASATLPSRT